MLWRRVFEALGNPHLQLKPQECNFLKSSVPFLGHCIDTDGVIRDAKNVKKVVEYPVPRNVSELRTLLGMEANYRKLIASSSKMGEISTIELVQKQHGSGPR